MYTIPMAMQILMFNDNVMSQWICRDGQHLAY